MNASMPDPGPPDQSESGIERAVFGEQVALAYRLTPPTLLASLVPSFILCGSFCTRFFRAGH